MDIIWQILLVVALTGVVGGPYVLYLAYFNPGFYRKPGLAKKQGVIATLVGVALFAVYFIFRR